MIDFFNALSDFLASNPGKNFYAVIIITIVIIVVTTVFLTWMICTKIFLKLQLNKCHEVSEKNKNLEAQVSELQNELKKVNHELMKCKVRLGGEEEISTAKAFDKFLN